MTVPTPTQIREALPGLTFLQEPAVKAGGYARHLARVEAARVAADARVLPDDDGTVPQAAGLAARVALAALHLTGVGGPGGCGGPEGRRCGLLLPIRNAAFDAAVTRMAGEAVSALHEIGAYDVADGWSRIARLEWIPSLDSDGNTLLRVTPAGTGAGGPVGVTVPLEYVATLGFRIATRLGTDPDALFCAGEVGALWADLDSPVENVPDTVSFAASAAEIDLLLAVYAASGEVRALLPHVTEQLCAPRVGCIGPEWPCLIGEVEYDLLDNEDRRRARVALGMEAPGPWDIAPSQLPSDMVPTDPEVARAARPPLVSAIAADYGTF